MKYGEIKDLKKKLRRNATKSEKLLWTYIRNRKLRGRKFLRQHAIIYDFNEAENFFFIPDFYCEAENLAIELDGKIHDFTKNKDIKRDEILLDQGIKVIRFKNEELKNISIVLEKIEACFHRNDDDLVFERKSRK